MLTKLPPVEREQSAPKLLLAQRKYNAIKPLLMFTMQVIIGAAALAGTILALFAWSGAGV
jgi:hypothetical protein